jgi:hypothetical protein
MGFNIEQGKQNEVKETSDLYKVYKSKNDKLYVVLGRAVNPLDKIEFIIFQELNQNKRIQVLPLVKFLEIMEPVLKIKL